MSRSQSEGRPNFLLIVADDLGWSDLGAFGGEISTPHLDSVAARGVRLTNFHTSPVCSTTRAMLMTGCDHHQVGLGSMVELMTPEQEGKPGYEGYLNDRAATIAERLGAGGYHTMMSGKWHLGIDPTQSPPWTKGFDRSFALFQGEHNHFGADQTEENAGHVGPSRYALDGASVRFPDDAYSSDYFAARMVDFLAEAPRDRPFFAYLAFTAPHCPLQAPPASIMKHRGRYDAGPEALREQRFARMRELNLSAARLRASDFQGGKPWNELEPAERALEARKMEVYAAMVEGMDSAVARVFQTLEASGRFRDTVIIFLSDNGPAGTLRETTPGWREWIVAHADNRLENIGTAGSYTSMGPRWAQAQAAPFFLFKRYTTEGGVRTCAFAAGPGVEARTECDAFVHVTDLAPTLLELAKIDPAPPPGKLPMRGSSAAETLRGKAGEVHASDEAIGWELAYGRGIRKGDWKAVYLPPAVKSISPAIPCNQWLLYNIASDPGETQDLAAGEPAKLRELVAAWDAYAKETGVVVPATA